MYTESQLNSLIADVEAEFTAHLAKAEESFKLVKAEDFPPKKKEESKEEPKEESKEAPKSESKEAPKADEPKAEEKPAEEGAEQAPPAEQEAAPEQGEANPAEQGEDSDNYDDEDMAHLDQMYGSMSRGELKAHHDCIRKCMDSHGLAKCEDGMAKSEKDVVVEVAAPTEEVSLLKSELEAVKAKSEEDKKALEAAVQTFLTKFVEKTVPAGKAITSLDIIAKTENGQEGKP